MKTEHSAGVIIDKSWNNQLYFLTFSLFNTAPLAIKYSSLNYLCSFPFFLHFGVYCYANESIVMPLAE